MRKLTLPVAAVLRSLTSGAVFWLAVTVPPVGAYAAPSVTEYANCSGILVIAAALTRDNDPEKSDHYVRDAESLQRKASRLKGYDKGVYMEMSFNSSGTYMDMIKRGAASKVDFWSDAGYCRGIAQ